MSDGGKGSAPRKQQDHEAYTKNWEQIFGKKQKESTLGPQRLRKGSKDPGVPSDRQLG